MTGASNDEVASRVARELEGVNRIWIAPELTALVSAIEPARRVDVDVSIAVLSARQLSAQGDVRGPRPSQAERFWAVLVDPLEIVDRCVAPVARVERAFSSLGVLEVGRGGLVIVELARGVSAKDFQAHAEPTLKISSRVDIMTSAPP